MATPGTIVNIVATSAPNNPPATTGAFFAIGQAARGAIGVPVAVSSMTQYVAAFGTRTFNGATPTLYDALDAFFMEGGTQAYVSRVSGPSAVAATHTLVDRAGSPLSTLTVTALGPGTWGNSVQVAVANGTVSNTFILTITNGTVTEVSPNLSSPTDAVNWAAASSATVTITNLGSATAAPNNNPAVVAAQSLTAGVDDTAPADSAWVTALASFPTDLGPGQVAAPGRTTPTVWNGLIAHAQAFNRFALLDGENTATAATVVSDASTASAAASDPSYGFMLAPWVTYAGSPPSAAVPTFPRTVAPSGMVAGLMARSDSGGNNADVAAAGSNGLSRAALGVTQVYSATDRSTLDAAGVGVIRLYRGDVQLYGYTSMALDPNWSDVGNCRLRMQIVDSVRLIGDQFDFVDIDAGGHVASAFGGQITALLQGLWAVGALYGVNPSDAFFVNVGPSVNTPVTAQARQLVAVVGVRMSPTANQVVISITRFPPTVSLPL